MILKEVGSPPEKWIYKPDIDLAQQHILVKLRFFLIFNFDSLKEAIENLKKVLRNANKHSSRAF